MDMLIMPKIGRIHHFIIMLIKGIMMKIGAVWPISTVIMGSWVDKQISPGNSHNDSGHATKMTGLKPFN